MRIACGYTLFYGSSEPFSNWFRSPFVTIDEVAGKLTFPSAEHYMMYGKAVCFGDAAAAEAILKAQDPRSAKRLGRQVKGFDAQTWNQVARRVVYRGCRLKFTQNPDCYEALVATRGTQLVEASPTDRIWGVGLAEDDDRILDPGQWRGTNWLGEVLTLLREDLLASTCSLERCSWG
jgi:ribA/ribD-fused uncharacterized protein